MDEEEEEEERRFVPGFFSQDAILCVHLVWFLAWILLVNAFPTLSLSLANGTLTVFGTEFRSVFLTVSSVDSLGGYFSYPFSRASITLT